jgi:hypothetical protein
MLTIARARRLTPCLKTRRIPRNSAKLAVPDPLGHLLSGPDAGEAGRACGHLLVLVISHGFEGPGEATADDGGWLDTVNEERPTNSAISSQRSDK